MTRLDTPETIRYGTPRKRAYTTNRAKTNESPAERIKRHVLVNEAGCWVWQLALVVGTGYGALTINYKRYLAHRLSYETFVGPIPPGLHIDHLCRNRACVNPEHLEPVTPQVNTLRGESIAAENAKKDDCPSGHPYNEENTYHYKGRRYCRTCQRDHLRAFRERRAAKRIDGAA